MLPVASGFSSCFVCHAPLQELKLTIIEDQGVPCVAVMDGKKRIRMGSRQSAGKQKASGLTNVKGGSCACVLCVWVLQSSMTLFMKVARHEKGSTASSAYQKAGKEFMDLRAGHRGQTHESIQERVRKLKSTPEPDIIRRSASKKDDLEDDDEMMGFSTLGRASGSNPAASSWQVSRPVLQKRPVDSEGDSDGLEVSSAPDTEAPVDPEDEEPLAAVHAKPGRGRGNGKRQRGPAGGSKGPPATSSKNAGAAGANGLAKLKSSFAEKKEQLMDAALWDPKTKPKAIEKAAKQLEAMAEKIIDDLDPAAQALVEQILQFAEDVKGKHSLFMDIRKNADWMKQPVSNADLDVLMKAEVGVLPMIFTHLGKELLKTVEEAGIALPMCLWWSV